MVVGVVIMAIEGAITVARAEARDVERTRILHGLHRHIGNTHLGLIYTHTNTRIAGSELEVSGASSRRSSQSVTPAAMQYRRQILGSLPQMKNTIFGTGEK